MKKSINIEGYSVEELLALPDEQVEAFVFMDEPIIFKIGTAEILGKFKIEGKSLVIELAQIEGGGEGILPLIFILAKKYAQKRELKKTEWIVHALNCAKPNPKLRPTMERRGFVIKEIEGIGKAYYFSQDV